MRCKYWFLSRVGMLDVHMTLKIRYDGHTNYILIVNFLDLATQSHPQVVTR